MRVLKTTLFHMMRAFRGLFILGSKLLSSLLLISFLLTLFLGHMDTVAQILIFIFAVGFGALAWYYDILLLKLKPDNVELTLYS